MGAMRNNAYVLNNVLYPFPDSDRGSLLGGSRAERPPSVAAACRRAPRRAWKIGAFE